MNEKDRQDITSNLIGLMQNINLNKLMPHLPTEGLFPNTMLQEYMTDIRTEEERKSKLILDVRKRGPDAKNKFINCLISAKQYDAARILKPDLNLSRDVTDSEGSGGDSLEHYSTPLEEIIIKKSDFPVCHSPSSMYNVTSNPKGLALVIINKKYDDCSKSREGANIDCDMWEQLFSGLDYRVICHKDVTSKDLETILNEFAQNPEHAHFHSSIVAISSHGIKKNILCSDMALYPVEDIFKKFNNFNCEVLKGRPKLFFIQACRGEAFDDGVALDTSDSIPSSYAQNKEIYVPTYTDMIITYSTIEGYVSIRNEKHGSWFVEIMCRVFMNHACDKHLDAMLKILQKEMRKRRTVDGEKQMCEIIWRGWDRDFYFNPGF